MAGEKEEKDKGEEEVVVEKVADEEELTDEQLEAAFNSGGAEVTNDKKNNDTKKEEEKAEDKTDDKKEEVEAKVEDKPESKEEKKAEVEYVPLTREVYDRLLAIADKVPGLETKLQDQLSKAFGSIGGLKRAVDGIVKSRGELSEEDLDKLVVDFPELGVQVKSILRKAFKSTPKQEEPEKEDDENKVDDRTIGMPGKVYDEKSLESLKRKYEDELISKEIDESHPGWVKIVGVAGSKAPFRVWLDKQGEEYAKATLSTRSPTKVIKALDKFKADEAKAKAEPATKKEDAKKIERKEALRAAIQPKGVGTIPPKQKTEQDHFDDGFKEERAR